MSQSEAAQVFSSQRSGSRSSNADWGYPSPPRSFHSPAKGSGLSDTEVRDLFRLLIPCSALPCCEERDK